MRAFPTLTALGTLAVMLPCAVQGQDTEWNRYTLEDLAGVFVQIEASEACGLDAGAVEAEARAALDAGGVPLLSRDAMLESPGLPELRVSVACTPGDGVTAFGVAVRMQQAVQMVRDPQITLSEAVTWSADTVAAAAPAGLSAAVRGAMAAELEAFAVAFAAANPADEATGDGK